MTSLTHIGSSLKRQAEGWKCSLGRDSPPAQVKHEIGRDWMWSDGGRVGSDGVGWGGNGMGSDGVGWDEMGWDRIGWSRVGWDEMGWDGVG